MFMPTLTKLNLPGPKARAILERDRHVVSPSYVREHELVLEPRQRQTNVHPRTQLRCVDTDFTRSLGSVIRG